MKHLTKTMSLVVLSIVSCVVLSACATNGNFRTYYVDRNCNYFYVDSMGNRVVDNSFRGNRLQGLPMHRDIHGRWFYEDSFGNRIYQTAKYCR